MIYRDGELEEAEKRLNQGLKNKGPYCALGYLLSRKAVDILGKKSLGEMLQSGPAGFLIRCLEVENNELQLPASARKDIVRLGKSAGQSA